MKFHFSMNVTGVIDTEVLDGIGEGISEFQEKNYREKHWKDHLDKAMAQEVTSSLESLSIAVSGVETTITKLE